MLRVLGRGRTVFLEERDHDAASAAGFEEASVPMTKVATTSVMPTSKRTNGMPTSSCAAAAIAPRSAPILTVFAMTSNTTQMRQNEGNRR